LIIVTYFALKIGLRRDTINEMRSLKKPNLASGFSIVDTMVSIAIFLMLVGTVYQVATLMFKSTQQNREGASISNLADQYLELVHNLPYSGVGTAYGIPHGVLPDSAHPVTTTYNGSTYSIYYEVTYIDDPADGTILAGTDSAPDDYKQVKLSITNTFTNKNYYFVTNIVPRGLEGLASGGALSISVIDASGNPVAGANIDIVSAGITPPIILSRTSDSTGHWVEVGVPNGTNAYQIRVSKTVAGQSWSVDSTYPITVGNPNPTKPNATVLNGQVTAVTFAIDQTSTLTFSTVDSLCAPVASVGLNVLGAKLIGTSPSVYKFNNNYTTDGSGLISLSPIEWDTYIPTLTGGTYMIYGSSPTQQINLLPNTTQNFTVNVGPVGSGSNLLTIVKDSSTGNPIEGATVELSRPSGYDVIKLTGGSLQGQIDWSGGTGQANYTNTTKYFSDDGGIDNSSGIKLLNSSGSAIVSSGSMISSSFDTGTSASTYTNLTWQPPSQSSGATAKFQIATNNDNATWNYVGPDGTNSTYFTAPGQSTSSVNNNNRYFRYKAFLATSNPHNIPVITSVTANYVSGCFTPGQSMFSSISSASNYTLSVSMAGYTTKTITGLTISAGYNVQSISLAH
jgi:hypothetical protein